MATPLPLSLVTLDVCDTVATITINRPQAFNSLNPAVVHQLQSAFDRAIADSAVQGIVLAGAGKAFLVGADLDFFIRNIDSGDVRRIIQFTESGHRLLDSIDRSAKPVVARVQGAAIGAGVELALACDFVVATSGASFAFPETALGIYPGLGGTQRASRAVGVGLAKWMIYTGKAIAALDAWTIKLIHQVTAADHIAQFCASLASGRATCEPPPSMSQDQRTLAEFFARARVSELLASSTAPEQAVLARAVKQVQGKSPLALRLAEQIIDEGSTLTLEEGLRIERAHLGEAFASPDTRRRLDDRRQKRLG